MESLLHNLRYGLRLLRRSPGFTAIALVTLALGIGATTAMFSVVDAVLFRPLPYAAPQQLVLIKERIPRVGPDPFLLPAPDVLTFARENRSFTGVAGFEQESFDFTGEGTPERVAAARVNWNLFSVLGVRPLLGRGFTQEEDQPGRYVAVLSYRLWRQKFGGARDVLGRSIELSRRPYTIIGVMPPNFAFPPRPTGSSPPAVWVPMAFTAEEKADVGDDFNYGAVARLRAGVSLAQGQADVSLIAQRIFQTYPVKVRNEFHMYGLVQRLREDAVGQTREPLLILLGAVVLVLLISLSNVAHLLLARGSSRQKELAIRMALGADGRRLVTQLLSETVLLALVGGALGLWLAAWGTGALVSLVPANLPQLHEAGVDWRVLLFAVGISLLAGLAFGAAPAFFALRSNTSDGLKEAGRGSSHSRERRRLGSVFVVTQVALALVLLVGAGLLIRSFQRVLAVNPGFQPEHVITASVALPESQYTRGAQIRGFFTELLQHLQTLPGAQAAGLSTDLPMESGWNRIFSVQGYRPPPGAKLNMDKHSAVLGSYFQAMGIPLLRGRLFTAADAQGAPPVVIISESIAQRYFHGRDPIGHRLKWGPEESNSSWLTIVGVVGDVKPGPLDAATIPHTYSPYLQLSDDDLQTIFRFMNVAVRTGGDPAGEASAVRQAVWSLDRQLPVTDVRTMEQVIGESAAPRRFNMILVAVFAGLALLLAAVGLYGMIAYAVAQRTREIAIRMTLGATRRQVLGMVLRWGIVLVGTGIAAGLAGAFAVGGLLKRFLFGVGSSDPLTLAAVAAVLAAVALLACYVPARRATRVDPMEALRYE
jgi:putative ABC transport system permease protein